MAYAQHNSNKNEMIIINLQIMQKVTFFACFLSFINSYFIQY